MISTKNKDYIIFFVHTVAQHFVVCTSDFLYIHLLINDSFWWIESSVIASSINGLLQKIVPNFLENFRKIWQYKFSKMAFLAETAGNGVWDLIGDANSDLMVYRSSKSALWRRKIQFSVKIHKFGTISCESPWKSNVNSDVKFALHLVKQRAII